MTKKNERGIYTVKVEELKALLTKEFKDRENPAALGFLEHIAMNKYTLSEHRANRKRRHVFSPISILEYKLMMTVAVEYDEKEGTNYHEIVFEDAEKIGKGYGVLVIEPNKSFPRPQKRTVMGVKNGRVYIHELAVCYHFDFDYHITRTEDTILSGIEFDLVNRNYRLLGINANNCRTLVDMLKQIGGMFAPTDSVLETWTKDVLDNATKDSAFAAVAQECNLVALHQHGVTKIALALMQYIQFNDLKHVLNSEYYGKLYCDYLTPHVWDVNDILNHPEQQFQHGQSAAEVMGINPTREAYFRETLKCQSYVIVAQADALLETVHQVMPIHRNEDIEKIVQLIEDAYIRNAEAQLGSLIHLGKLGYTLDELHAYLAKVEKKQAIPIEMGFDALCRIVTRRELLTGEKKKFFPKYLRVVDDVFARDMNAKLDAFRVSPDAQLFERVKNKRSELWMDEKTFEILPPPNDDTASRTVSVCAEGTDTLLYKKKRGTRYTTILLTGNTVIKLSENIGEQHMEHLYAWAKKNNLIIGSRKLY